MKKRILLVILLLIVGLAVVHYARIRLMQRHLWHKEIFSLVPGAPVAYVQCSHLKTRLQELRASRDYARFIQSEFFQHLQQTDQWQTLSQAVQQIWRNPVLDPLRFIGTDLAVALYRAEQDAPQPDVLVLAKVDHLVKFEERMVYWFDRVLGLVGVQWEERYCQVPIYSVQRPDLPVPVYYAFIDDLFMAATSRRLLKTTILSALGLNNLPLERLPFRAVFTDMPAHRIVTGYVHPPLLAAELRRHALFHNLHLRLAHIEDITEDLPLAAIQLDADVRGAWLKTQLVNPVAPLEPGANAPLPDLSPPRASKTKSADSPLVASLYRPRLPQFWQHWQTVFASWEWTPPVSLPETVQALFGDIMECRLAETMTGTVYPLPDLACVVETPAPERAVNWLHTIVEKVLAQAVPSAAQRALVKQVNESYQQTTVFNVKVMFQNVLSYTAVGNPEPRSSEQQKAYGLVATNNAVVKRQLTALQAPAAPVPYVLGPPLSDNVVLTGRINNVRLAGFVQNLSQTTTFGLLAPRAQYPDLYRNLPVIIQGLHALPPLYVEAGTWQTGIYLELRRVEPDAA
jgi:hypothetical protein